MELSNKVKNGIITAVLGVGIVTGFLFSGNEGDLNPVAEQNFEVVQVVKEDGEISQFLLRITQKNGFVSEHGYNLSREEKALVKSDEDALKEIVKNYAIQVQTILESQGVDKPKPVIEVITAPTFDISAEEINSLIEGN